MELVGSIVQRKPAIHVLGMEEEIQLAIRAMLDQPLHNRGKAKTTVENGELAVSSYGMNKSMSLVFSVP
jgi:hypothetical protein